MTDITITFEPRARARERRVAEAAARPPRRYPARVARQLALAHALQRRVDVGEFADHATMSRALGLTRARISQLMDLLLLAPDIQAEILFLEVPPGAQPVSERRLRDAVLDSLDWGEQRRRWDQLLPRKY
ncbi:MAG: hypothetical protein IPL40_14940 [Proteobacteria bacterium]|nr:hypothetical protein [Pseudomonadota bacterium]